MATAASSAANCPICLDGLDNAAFVNPCMHQFCFGCMRRWCETKAECPLCKRCIQSILHLVAAADDFQELSVRPPAGSSVASFQPWGAAFFPNLRWTLAPAALLQPNPSPPRVPSPPEDDTGLLGPSGLAGLQQREAARPGQSRSPLSRRTARLAGAPRRQAPEQEQGLRSHHPQPRTVGQVPAVPDNDHLPELSAAVFRHNPAMLQRLLPWLKRELRLLFGTHQTLAVAVEFVTTNVRRYDVGSLAFEDDLRPFLLGRMEQFICKFTTKARRASSGEAIAPQAPRDTHAPAGRQGRPAASSRPDSLLAADGSPAPAQGPSRSRRPPGPGREELPRATDTHTHEAIAATGSPQQPRGSSTEEASREGREEQSPVQAAVPAVTTEPGGRDGGSGWCFCRGRCQQPLRSWQGWEGIAWESPASPKEEGEHSPGRFPAQKETVTAAALAGTAQAKPALTPPNEGTQHLFR
nr:PREDICTED: E3 ubiquitin-protein ligase Topors-like [Apteryx mantelli mantelli]